MSDGDSLYVYNGHGDVTALVSLSGVVIQTYDYDAFGVEVSPDEEDENPFRYAGQYYDTETGTYYLRARYYDPSIGRFTQQDNWGYADPNDPLSLNLYVYCYGNPTKYIDLSGNFAIEGTIGVGILIFALFAICVTAIAIQDLPAPQYSYHSSQSVFYTNTRILPDIDVVIEEIREDLQFVYRLAYIDANGNLNPFGIQMNHDTALSMLGITEVINFTKEIKKLIEQIIKNSPAMEEIVLQEEENNITIKHWGIYTESQMAAKKLADSTGCYKAPEVHDDGYYGHYHDFTHTIHIWYGFPVAY